MLICFPSISVDQARWFPTEGRLGKKPHVESEWTVATTATRTTAAATRTTATKSPRRHALECILVIFGIAYRQTASIY
jgi:hypothetical protein